MKITNVIAFLLVFTFSFFCYGGDESGDVKKLKALISEFQEAIAEKGESEFLNLFYDHTIVFLGINPDKRKGAKPSNNGLMYSTHVGFIGWIAGTSRKIEEKIWDIDIQTDGDIAVAYFKYSFHVDGKKTNYGDESWSLVKTANGWKIASVIYSANYL